MDVLFGVRFVVSISLSLFGIFLVYFGSENRWCVGAGFACFTLGLILLVLPLHWEWFLCECQGKSYYCQPFQHDGANVSRGRV